MSNKRQYSITEMRQALADGGGSPSKAAEILGCTRGTIYRYMQKHPEVAQALEQERGAGVVERAQYPREVFEKAIAGSHGLKSVVAARVGCSRSTVDNALERWRDLGEMLETERSRLVSMAVNALVKDIEDPASDGHQRAYTMVLKMLGKDEGFTERTEVTGAGGQPLFALSQETIEMAKMLGMDMSEVGRQFEQMVRVAAAQRGISSDKGYSA